MRRIIIVLSVSLGVLGLMSGPTAAQVPPHNHLLTVPGTGAVVQVAPHRCDLGVTVENGFLQFHQHVHLGRPAGTGGLIIEPDFCV
jgi:hypothetical protein